MKIRLAEERDCGAILQIYSPYITDTVISFECKVLTEAEFSQRMANIQKMLPWLVCEIEGHVAGYAYASRHREREAYDWSVDFSVYIDERYQRNKIGKALYHALLELVRLQGYYNAYAGVAIPNVKSEGFHEAIGFQEVGTYHNVGYKFGAWHDVKWYELKMKEHVKSPTKPVSIHEIKDSEEYNSILLEAGKLIRRG